MCVWSGCNGISNAAETALEMLKKTEGLWAGYYTGGLSSDKNGLHWQKMMGNCAKWENNFSLAGLPGKCALFHSRTNSGGGNESAHPYVEENDMVATISQGSIGFFADICPDMILREGNRLLANGVKFRTSLAGRQVNILNDGRGVCMSDLVTALIFEKYQQCNDPVATLRHVAQLIPEESITNVVFADHPEKVYSINVSQSLMIGEYSNGLVFGTTSLGFPSGTKNIAQLPYNSITVIDTQNWETLPLVPKFDIMAELPDCAEDVFCSWLQDHPGALLPHVVDGALRPLCEDKSKLYPCAAFGYRMVEKLFKENRLQFIPAYEVMSGLVLQN